MGKTPEVKTKRLFYRRANCSTEGFTEKDKEKEVTLEALLKTCHTHCKMTSLRTFKGLYGSEIQCPKYEDKNGDGLLLHIASYVPDQATSAIEKASTTSENSSVSTVPAPEGKNFLDGDAFVLIKGNDVVLTLSGIRENVVTSYMSQILDKNDFKKAGLALEFRGIAKDDKVKMIQTQGVKAIELNASLYEASLMHLEKQNEKSKRETKIFDLPGAVADTLKQVFAKDKTLKEITEQENVNIKLSISFDGNEARKKVHKKTVGFGSVGKSRLEKASELILQEANKDDVDGFTIITGDNNKIKSDEIVVSDTFRIKTLGKSLDHTDAFAKLQEYYTQLKDRGTLTK